MLTDRTFDESFFFFDDDDFNHCLFSQVSEKKLFIFFLSIASVGLLFSFYYSWGKNVEDAKQSQTNNSTGNFFSRMASLFKKKSGTTKKQNQPDKMALVLAFQQLLSRRETILKDFLQSLNSIQIDQIATLDEHRQSQENQKQGRDRSAMFFGNNENSAMAGGSNPADIQQALEDYQIPPHLKLDIKMTERELQGCVDELEKIVSRLQIFCEQYLSTINQRTQESRISLMNC